MACDVSICTLYRHYTLFKLTSFHTLKFAVIFLNSICLFLSEWNFESYCNYDKIQYDTIILTCAQKLADSQLNLPHNPKKTEKTGSRRYQTSPALCIQLRYLQMDYYNNSQRLNSPLTLYTSVT